MSIDKLHTEAVEAGLDMPPPAQPVTVGAGPAVALSPIVLVAWAYIRPILVRHGLPLAEDGLRRLRDLIEASNLKPRFAKAVLLAAIDALLADLPSFLALVG